MRAVHFALMISLIHVALGIVALTGLFGSIYYDNTAVPSDDGSTFDIASDSEQNQFSFKGFREQVKDKITWSWIRELSRPWYDNNDGIKHFVDGLSLLLNGITVFLVTVAFFQFIRNQVEVL